MSCYDEFPGNFLYSNALSVKLSFADEPNGTGNNDIYSRFFYIKPLPP